MADGITATNAGVSLTLEQARSMLTGIGGSNANDQFENLPAFAWATAFFDPSAAMTAFSFNFNANTELQWTSNNFPSNTQAFVFDRAEIISNIRFTASAVTRNTQYWRAFFEGSSLSVFNEGNEVFSLLPLDKLVKERYQYFNNITGAAATYEDIKDKFNNEFKLPKPIIISSGENPTFSVATYAGLTTAAWATAVDPVVTKVPQGVVTDPTQAYYITLRLIGVKAKAKK